jgi:hypothetical protein
MVSLSPIIYFPSLWTGPQNIMANIINSRTNPYDLCHAYPMKYSLGYEIILAILPMTR